MKNRKRLLFILLILIVVILFILGIVLIFGGMRNKEYNDFKTQVSEAACEYASMEYNNPSLLEAYPHLKKIKYSTLVATGYLDGNLINPKTHETVAIDNQDYVEITFDNSQYICSYKEG